MAHSKIAHPASFRDNSGVVFKKDGYLLRQVNLSYKNDYDFLMCSGLYQELVDKGLLLPHKEVQQEPFNKNFCYKILMPYQLPFISYPFEWCFSQIKDAALLYLKIQKIAMKFGMSLKDASIYNIQFLKGQPVYIDTLSFEIYKKGDIFKPYKQFCQHFVAPLALMKYSSLSLNKLLVSYIDGVPLSIASSILPLKSFANLYLFIHIYLHAKAQKLHKKYFKVKSSSTYSKSNLCALIDSLESTIKSIKEPPVQSSWCDYYNDLSYSKEAFNSKKKIVKEYIDTGNCNIIWDIGTNTGELLKHFIPETSQCIAIDFDEHAIEVCYRNCKTHKIKNILPLIIDILNPSPDIGWNNNERFSLVRRGPADLVLALALIHHLTIANNIPFRLVANFFSKIARCLIIEFVPKNDKKVQEMLMFRKDIFNAYTIENFEKEFSSYFYIISKVQIEDSNRMIFFMKRR